mgnify:CR=1 FL=1
MNVRVLIITNYVLEYRHKLFEELSKYFTITVLTLQQPTDDKRINHSFVLRKNYVVKSLKRYRIGKLIINPGLFSLTALNELIDSHHIIIINDNLPNFISNLVLYIYSKYKKKKIILWSEDFFYSSRYLSLHKKLLMKLIRKLVRNIDALLLFNEYDFEKFKQLKSYNESYHNIKFYLIRQAVSFKHEILNMKLQKEVKKRNRFPVFGYMGYLKKIKNLDILLRFFAENNKIKLLIAGDGDEKIKKEINKFENIEFVGFLTTEAEKNSFFSKIDYLILPSFYDAWGLVINEAAHRGIPCIVSKEAKASEIVKKVNEKLIFDPFSYESFKSVMDYAINLWRDYLLYSKISEDIYNISLNYSIEEAVKEFVLAIYSLLS